MPGPQFHEDIAEVIQLVPRQRTTECTVEQIVDVSGPQFHEDIAEISGIVTSSGGLREIQPVCQHRGLRYLNLKVEVGLHFSRCRADDDDIEPLEWKRKEKLVL